MKCFHDPEATYLPRWTIAATTTIGLLGDFQILRLWFSHATSMGRDIVLVRISVSQWFRACEHTNLPRWAIAATASSVFLGDFEIFRFRLCHTTSVCYDKIWLECHQDKGFAIVEVLTYRDGLPLRPRAAEGCMAATSPLFALPTPLLIARRQSAKIWVDGEQHEVAQLYTILYIKCCLPRGTPASPLCR